MKKNILMVSAAVILLSAVFCGAADIPTDVRLSVDTESITVTWVGDSDADSYNVYWSREGEEFGEPASVLDSTAVIDEDTGDRILEYRIATGIEPATRYRVAVSSVEDGDESARTTAVQITTEAEEPPATPTGFGVTSLEDITATSVRLKWNASSEEDIAKYEIAYRPNPNNQILNPLTSEENGVVTAAITNLTPSTRYFFTLRAVDDSGNRSEPTPELVVDLPVDTFPPFAPAGITATLSGNQDVTVRVENGNQNMADFAGHIIRYGQTSGQPDKSVNIGTSSAYTFSELPENTTWYFSAVAYDNAGATPVESNQSDPTAEKSVTIEEIQGFMEQSDDFDSGCFIGSLWDAPAYEVTENKNKIGVSAGYYKPAESDFKDFYGNDTYPVAIFYDRSLARYLSIDFKAAFLEESGTLQTVSGAPTSISSSLTLVPVAISVNVNFPITSYIWGFVGIGPDYWRIEEDSDSPAIEDTSEWVGGYHGKAGFWFYNQDPDFKDWGAVFETSYSRIDRFGGNDLDMGGWMFLLGLFYSF